MWSGNMGGIEKLTIWLAENQLKRNDLSNLILIGTNKGTLFETLKQKNISYDILGLKNGWGFNLKSWRKLRHHFKSTDIIHIHTFNPWVLFAAIISGKKIVYTLHGNFVYGRKVKLTDKVNQYCIGLMLNHFTDIVTFNSKFTESTAHKRYGLKSVRKQLVYNGVDFSNLILTDNDDVQRFREQHKNKFIIGTVARFAGVKRIDRLIDAFKIFSKDKSDVLLLLTGDGPLRQSLEQKVKEDKLEEHVVFTGFQKNAADWESLMDVCVFPSQNESFGLVAVEAMYLGKPVIVFNDGGGLVEIIHSISPEDITGNIHEAAERMQFYYNLKNQTQQPDAIQKRKMYALNFSIENMERNFYEIYQSLLN